MNTLGTNVDMLLDVAARIATVLFVLYVIVVFVQAFFRIGPIAAFLRLLSVRVLVPLLGVVVIWFLSIALVFIEPPYLGVVVSVISPGGVRPAPLNAGLHWIVPLIEEVAVYPIYWQTYTMSNKIGEGNRVNADGIRARTKDGQEILLDTSTIYRIDSGQAVQIHIDWQNRYQEEFVRPILQGYVRGLVSEYEAKEINSEARRNLEAAIDVAVRAEFAEKGFIVDQFLLRDITFSAEYVAAIEAKQVAFEQQTRALYEAESLRRIARGEADATRLRAEGTADAIRLEAEGRADAIVFESQARSDGFRLIGAALQTNPDLIQYYYVERLTPNIRAMLLPSNAPFILPLDSALNALEETPTPLMPESTEMPQPEATSEVTAEPSTSGN